MGNTFLGEAVLWMPWRYCGDAYAVTECFVISLNAKAFGETVQRCPYVHCHLGRYAQSLVRILQKSQKKGKLSDVSDMQDAQYCLDRVMQSGARSGRDFEDDEGE